MNQRNLTLMPLQGNREMQLAQPPSLSESQMAGLELLEARQNDAKVIDAPESKLNTIFGGFVSGLCAALGIRDTSLEGNSLFIASWGRQLVKEYPFLTERDFNHMLSLDFLRGRKFDHYGQISLVLLCEVFAQYRVFSLSQMSEAQRLLPKPEERKHDPESVRKEFIRSLIESFERYPNIAEEDLYCYPEYYQLLQDEGIFSLSSEIKKELFKNAQTRTESKEKYLYFVNQIAYLKSKYEGGEIKYVRAKRLAMVEACKLTFKSLKGKGINLKEVLL